MSGTYSTGTLSVGSGSTSVTGTGTQWAAVGIREDDFLIVNGLAVPIASVNSNTSLTLRRGWPGSGLSSVDYDIDLRDDAQRSLATFNSLRLALGSGTLASLAGLEAGANEMPYWTGAGVMGKTPITSAARDLLQKTTIVQSSVTDETDDRLMLTGAFGLGSMTLPTIPGNDFNLQQTTGWSRNLGTAENAPRTFYGQMVMTMRGYEDSFFQMSAIRSLDQLWFRRAGTDGVPGDWREILHSGNIVGDLDVATDTRIIEQGSNANGNYVRFADGTQICWHSMSLGSILNFGSGTYASPYRTAQQSWTFPANFVDGAYIPFGSARLTSPVSSGTRTALGLTGQFGRFSNYLNSISITRHSSDSTDDDVTALLCAIGQYK